MNKIESFAEWKERLDTTLIKWIGMDYSRLPDAPYREWYESGMKIFETARWVANRARGEGNQEEEVAEMEEPVTDYRDILLDDWGKATLLRVKKILEKYLANGLLRSSAPISLRVNRIAPGVDSWRLEAVTEDPETAVEIETILRAAALGAVMALEL